MSTPERGTGHASAAWSPWRVVVTFGVVSLLADMVYEGARSMYGPLLASLGAGAVLVGLVTGAGEAMALVLRLVFGPLADRSGRYWTLTIAGYGLTAVSVPLLATTPFLGGAGLTFAIVLILLERSGKAVRSPSKTTLLARATRAVGRGRGFGVHKAMDQIGAFAGPLTVAAVVAAFGGIWTGMMALAVPATLAMAVLLWMRTRVPTMAADPSEEVPGSAVDADDTAAPPTLDSTVSRSRRRTRGWLADAAGGGLPPAFFWYAGAASLTTGGLVGFGMIGYHLTVEKLTAVSVVPVLYAGAMLAEAAAAVVVGVLYDKISSTVLYGVPVLVALVPGLALSDSLHWVIVGLLAWGFAAGLQDSIIKALVADLVDPPRHATAYGVFAAIQGATAVAGGAVIGWLYSTSLTALVIAIALTQAAALAVLLGILRRSRAASHPRR